MSTEHFLFDFSSLQEKKKNPPSRKFFAAVRIGIGIIGGFSVGYTIFLFSPFGTVASFFSKEKISSIPISASVAVIEEVPFESVSFQSEALSKRTRGLTMFRGNPTRTLYGRGPVPQEPVIRWKYPEKPMCSKSTTGNKTSTWCGAGWTGQPVVWDRNDGVHEIIFGAYDGKIHFVNGRTGIPTREAFPTGDIIKGSLTLDPDGFPLLYGGSRDNFFRIFALDQGNPQELWKLDADTLGGVWNNDWDSNPLVIDDVLYQGGENGIFYAIKLNRRYDTNGAITVDPKIIFAYKTYDADLIEKVGSNVSIENSPVVVGNRLYVANSGGRILGFDMEKIQAGLDPVVFDYWVGDDVDATMVADEKGFMYVSVERERFTERSQDIGQLLKLDPLRKDPLIWGRNLDTENTRNVGGVWATPALYGEYLYVPTHQGNLLAVDRKSGTVVWNESIGFHAWSSPNIVDGKLVVASCADGSIRSYSLMNPVKPRLEWDKKVGSGCIESTPAIWDDSIYVTSRDGFMYALSESEIENYKTEISGVF